MLCILPLRMLQLRRRGSHVASRGRCVGGSAACSHARRRAARGFSVLQPRLAGAALRPDGGCGAPLLAV
jgi:hypothetical protein